MSKDKGEKNNDYYGDYDETNITKNGLNNQNFISESNDSSGESYDLKSENDYSFDESDDLKSDLSSLFKMSETAILNQSKSILKPEHKEPEISNENNISLSPDDSNKKDRKRNLNKKKTNSKKHHNKKANILSLPINIFILICIISAMIGGSFGGISALMLGRLTQKTSDESEQITEGDTGIGTTEETIPEETLAGLIEPITGELTEAVTDKADETPNTLSAKEIYANSVDSVVGISGQTTINNGLWGQSKATVAGSGFIISDTGYIITNAHVVNGVQNLSVTLYDKKSYAASLVGLEVGNDIAVIKISAKNLNPITWGDSDNLAVGEELIIIGNPLGELTHSLTNGVVSALSRQIGNDLEVMNMFQTNAAINSGNSGGPVFDTNGKVVGVATSKYASSSIEGLSFCIPSNDIKGIIDDIIKYGYAKNKPSLGVTVQTVTSSIASKYNIVLGAYVVAMDKNSAAAKAGIQETDVIVELNGKPISKVSDLQSILKGLKSNQSVPITIYRSGSQKSFNITFDEKRPSNPRTSYSNVYDL